MGYWVREREINNGGDFRGCFWGMKEDERKKVSWNFGFGIKSIEEKVTALELWKTRNKDFCVFRIYWHSWL